MIVFVKGLFHIVSGEPPAHQICIAYMQDVQYGCLISLFFGLDAELEKMCELGSCSL